MALRDPGEIIAGMPLKRIDISGIISDKIFTRGSIRYLSINGEIIVQIDRGSWFVVPLKFVASEAAKKDEDHLNYFARGWGIDPIVLRMIIISEAPLDRINDD